MMQVLSVYVVANSLMLCLALPAASRRCLTLLTASLPLASYHRWFEMIFLGSAVLTMAASLIDDP